MGLIQSAKLNCHDPYRYLKDVLERLPTHPCQSNQPTPATPLATTRFGRLISVDPVPIQRNFLLEVDHAYVIPPSVLVPGGGSGRNYFLIGMVDFSRIDSFFASLDREAALAMFLLERN